MSHRRALNFSKAEISLRLLPLQRCGTAQDLPSAFVRSAGFEGCDGLIEALDGSSETLQMQYFVKSTLPFIVSEAIAIADRFPDGLPLLVEPSRVCLSRSQVCSILASMFFGVLPLPCTGEGRAKQDWPSASFEYFITERAHPSTTAKLRCVLQYFNVMRERTAAASMNGTVTFCRVALEPTSVPDFSTSSVRMVPLVPHATGSIDDAQHCLHVDFANEYLGGGVLFSGAVQEEIRFSVSPECLAALPLCPSMLRREAILLAGTEVFSKVTGYSRSLLFAGPHEDRTPRIRDLPASDDALASAYGAASSLSAAPSSGAADETREDPNTILSCIVAIDALPFASRQLLPQLEKATFDRDLVKVCCWIPQSCAFAGLMKQHPHCNYTCIRPSSDFQFQRLNHRIPGFPMFLRGSGAVVPSMGTSPLRFCSSGLRHRRLDGASSFISLIRRTSHPRSHDFLLS
jgi:hypothetical protein